MTWRRRTDGTWVVAGPSRLVRRGAVTLTTPDGATRTVVVVALGREFVRKGVAMRYGYVAPADQAVRGPRCDECGRSGATTTARDGSGLLGRVCAGCARLAEDERRYGAEALAVPLPVG